jgi:hypothetical protein
MPGGEAAVELAYGARATEGRLLDHVSALRDEVRADPKLLARPAWIVVPSGSLRAHVAERVVAEVGAVAGLEVQTLHAVALGILRRAGVAHRGGDELVEVLARRFAAEENVLSAAFAAFVDGYRTVAGTVRDLLDAGLDETTGEVALERLIDTRVPKSELRRAAAVVRVALRVSAALAERDLGGRAELLRKAREAFERDPERALPARALVVHGFADATGRASDLLEALIRRLPARVLIDLPPDPVEPERVDLGAAFTDRLRARLGAGPAGTPEPNGPDPALFRAPGAEAEVREVARRVRALLAAGARAERIGIVARDLGPYRSALGVHLRRLAVPCSAVGARAAGDGAARRIAAFAELLDQHARVPTDRWLDAVRALRIESEDGEKERRAPAPDLRLGLRVAGAGRLEETAELDPSDHLDEQDRMLLPLRTGLGGAEPGAPPADGESARRFRANQARLAGRHLRGAVAAARAVRRRLQRWPRKQSLARHLAELERLRRVDLGWRTSDREEQRVRTVLDALGEAWPDEELTLDELSTLLLRALRRAASSPLLGAGGGVQVLDAMEARARTFEHLFVLGLCRDVFPRVGREDPLLGDELRAALADVLPEMPVKARARDEDRYLFAQLASSSPHVTFSWQLSDDAGKPRVVSPLIERLLGESGEEDVDTAPPLFPQDPARARGSGPRTAHEHAVLGGLHAGCAGQAARLALAAGDARRGAVQARVLEAFERGPFEPARLAPWLGFLGEQAEAGVRPDPRREGLYVTRFEALARCPWQAVLTRLLRIERSPDPLDSLPAIEPRMVGNVVHGVLEAIALDALRAAGEPAEELDAVLAREPVRAPWPDAEALEELMFRTTHDLLRRERRPQVGLVRMIVEVARPHVLATRAFLEDEQRTHRDQGVLGVEVLGSARVPTPVGELELRFRADRIDRRGTTTVLTDFKTGRRPTTRKKLREEGVPRGENLQPLAYVLGAMDVLGAAHKVRGRYLQTSADPDQRQEPDVGVSDADGDLAADFGRALATMVEAWNAGVFFPRLTDVEGERPAQACATCDVAQACLRGDSGARRAVVALAHGAEAGGAGEPLRALWQLAGAKRGQA